MGTKFSLKISPQPPAPGSRHPPNQNSWLRPCACGMISSCCQCNWINSVFFDMVWTSWLQLAAWTHSDTDVGIFWISQVMTLMRNFSTKEYFINLNFLVWLYRCVFVCLCFICCTSSSTWVCVNHVCIYSSYTVWQSNIGCLARGWECATNATRRCAIVILLVY